MQAPMLVAPGRRVGSASASTAGETPSTGAASSQIETPLPSLTLTGGAEVQRTTSIVPRGETALAPIPTPRLPLPSVQCEALSTNRGWISVAEQTGPSSSRRATELSRSRLLQSGWFRVGRRKPSLEASGVPAVQPIQRRTKRQETGRLFMSLKTRHSDARWFFSSDGLQAPSLSGRGYFVFPNAQCVRPPAVICSCGFGKAERE